MAGQYGEAGLRFAVLGPVQAWRDGLELELGTPLQRSILAMLLLREGRAVTPVEMIDAVWGHDAPPRALGALRTYVSRLRAVLEPGRSPRTRPELLTSVGRGYALRLPPGVLDLGVFERRVTAAENSRRDGDHAGAAETLREALALWTGEPLAGAVGPYIDNQRDRLVERRIGVVETLMELDLRLGRHADVIPELIALTAEHPLRERLRGQLMLAYYRCGRQADALAVFSDTRRALVDELGIDPGHELAALHQRVLSADPGLAWTAAAPSRATRSGPAASDTPERPRPPVRPPVRQAAPPRDTTAAEDGDEPVQELPRPAQLPAAVNDFTGRKEAVNRLRTLLTSATGSEGMPVVAVSGIGGVGKTALAVHVAHSVHEVFPDGQLYADLRGYTEEPTAPESVLAAFLRALGLPVDVIPDGLAERAALFRSLLADRSMLVLLDNARDAEQVEHLLPGTAGCAAVITSRVKLADLPSARLLDLEVMEPEEALGLFSAVAGPERIAVERAAAMDVVAVCGFLPLAVRIVAARLAARPAWTVASLVPRLADERRRLDEMRIGHLAVDATFALGYGHLDPGQARAFRLLSLPNGPDISLLAAAGVLTLSPMETEDMLESLVDVSLLEAPAPGRYRFHDLLKLFARRQAEATEDPAAGALALRRLLGFYLASAQAAHRLAYEGSVIADHLVAVPGTGRGFSGAAEAIAWLTVEAETLFAAIGQTAESGATPEELLPAADLLLAMEPLLESGAYVREFVARTGAVLSAAERVGDRASELRCRYVLGRVMFGGNRLAGAAEQFQAALELATVTGDRIVTGELLNGLAVVSGRARRHEEALTWFDAALRAYKEIGAAAGEALVASYSARDHLALGHPEAAIAAAERGLAIFTELGSGAGMARARYHLGIVLTRVGRLTEAVVHHAECLDFFRAGGQKVWEQRVCCRLAETFIAAERFRDAVRHAEQALTLSREIGHPYGEALSLTVLGRALAGTGSVRRSGDCLRRALEIFTRLGSPEAADLRALLKLDQVSD
ncbi:transcriptional regulator AfsR [Sphaerisporangium rubeum]|uniref:DNA-binding SARP family transcriptional activator/tetratricopeptide (TPR) repeat protein n=1 Tax=Sphaerisporangium rubeum TaxID=321317 RepID=A0A7X0I8R2_9ACTN|nr:BTAD domain-containing putative transcriptional regulator [Sphaerisporangium rubeum]MBB6470685.1 DNA-binding SARP family transcriptional activator/tetratricopeptide (TPR) repeat protein [Sphaerisporangium rubeum]